MKKTSFLPALATVAAVAGSLLIAPAAHAYDGQITFNGEITSMTCTINAGTPDFTVTLPTVSTTALNAAGVTAGRTPFAIALTNCAPTTAANAVSTYFEPGATVNPNSNQLYTTGGATNVELRLLNADDYSKILAGAAQGSQNSHTFSIDATGNATMNYFVEYVAVGGAATAGMANSNIYYTVAYQ